MKKILLIFTILIFPFITISQNEEYKNPAIEIGYSANDQLTISFPNDNDNIENSAVCVTMNNSNFSIEIPEGTNATFSVDIPTNGTIGNSPFDLNQGRTNNPVVVFPSGGTITLSTNFTGDKKFNSVTIKGKNDKPAKFIFPLKFKKIPMKNKDTN